jgi:hypothetical protein
MATLSTAVVNAGYSNAGAPTVTKRGSATYFSVTKSVVPLTGAGLSLTSFSYNDFITRNSLKVALPVAQPVAGTTSFYAIIKQIGYTAEAPEVQPVDVKTNPYYLLNTQRLNGAVSESKVGTTPFYHKLANYSYSAEGRMLSVDPKTNITANSLNSRTIISVNEEPILVMDNTTFNMTLSTRQYLGQGSVTQTNIGTTPFYVKIANLTFSEYEPVQVMDTTTFNSTLGTRDGKVILSVSEEPISVINVSSRSVNINSPAIIVTNPTPVLAVDQNTNSGRIDTTRIQPKGTEAGNIGFAQAFGNTTIVGKWF